MTNDCCKIQDYLQSFDAAQTFCDVVVVIVVVDVVVAAVAVVVDDDVVVIEILRAYDLCKLDPTCHYKEKAKYLVGAILDPVLAVISKF